MSSSDGELWGRSRAGDNAAFAALFERHAPAIYNYCFRSTANWALAEDLTSVVFLEAWRRRDKELGGNQVLPWLYGIAANVVRSQWRSERRFRAALGRVPPPQPESDFAETAQQRVDDERDMAKAIALLRKLRREEQEVFVLCAWMELSYEDAAFALGVPVGTVRSRLSRARQHLMELDPEFGTYRD